MPVKPQRQAAQFLKRRHVEWGEFQRVWRWLADSLEGGQRYQCADYLIDPIDAAMGVSLIRSQQWPYNGIDMRWPSGANNQYVLPIYGEIAQRNLVPHLSETGPDGRDLYTLRLNRTPVPDHLSRAVTGHIAKILAKEVRREGPEAIVAWWEDVDGKGTEIKEWVEETAGPLFLALGQLDILCDRPAAPADAEITTRADEIALRLDRCLVKVILPEYLPWWELNPDGKRYVEALVFDPYGYQIGGKDTGPVYFHWTDSDVVCYRTNGVHIPELTRDHGYGRVPIVRVFDRRLPRCRNSGVSRYATVAAAQKAVYNLESERYLSDVQQSHALLQGPEDYIEGQTPVTLGPGNVLPMKRTQSGSGAAYQPWSYLDPPKGAQEAIRQHVLDNNDTADRAAALAKPAGMTQGATVSQSGISKIADQTDGNQLLAAIAARLERLECETAELAAVVLGVPPEVEITYPRQFELDSVADVAMVLDDLQRACQQFGSLPQTEGELIKRLVSLGLPGVSHERMEELTAEVDAFAARHPDASVPDQIDPQTGQTMPRDAMPAEPGDTSAEPTLIAED